MAGESSGKILLEVVTPDHRLLSKEVDYVSAPGSEGDFGVLPGHCHFLTTLRIGELQYRVGEQIDYMSVLWGFAEVTPTKVTILAEIAEKAEDINVERAEAAVARGAAPGDGDVEGGGCLVFSKQEIRREQTTGQGSGGFEEVAAGGVWVHGVFL